MGRLVRSVPSGDVSIVVEEQGVGTPIVLVHGWSGSRASWDAVSGELARRLAVITYDHRGHGDSTHVEAENGYTIDLLLQDLEAVIAALDLAPFHLVGHSLGGLLAMRYALGHPGRLRSLVLVDTGARPAAGSEALMNPLADLVRAGGLDAYYELAAPFVGDGPDGDIARRRFRDDLDRLDPAAFVALALELTSYPSVLDELSQLQVATTVVVGELDGGLRPAAEDLAATIPGAVLEVIAAAGHTPQLEQPAAWLAVLERHLDRVEG